MRFRLTLWLAALTLAALPSPAPAWFGSPLQTLTLELEAAHVVLFGTLRNSTPPNPSGRGLGISTFDVEKRLKSHRALGDQKTLTLRCYVPEAKLRSVPFVVYGRVVDGKLSLSGHFPAKPGSDLLKYVTGVLALDGQKASGRARFYFEHLRHAETPIAQDALLEFRCIPYPVLREAAADLPADKLAAWIKDPKTPAYLAGIYALMLGHCSKNKGRDFAIVQARARHTRGFGDQKDLLTALVLLRPRDGWEQVGAILRDPNQPYSARLMGLWVAGFVVTSRPELVPRKRIVADVAQQLEHADVAAFAIDLLAKMKSWDHTDRILALRGRPKYDRSRIREAMVRFALRSPVPAAQQFVAAERLRDPGGVRQIETELK